MQGRTTRMTEQRRLAAITGMSGMASDLAGKCVELSRDLLPQVKRGAALLNASDLKGDARQDPSGGQDHRHRDRTCPYPEARRV